MLEDAPSHGSVRNVRPVRRGFPHVRRSLARYENPGQCTARMTRLCITIRIGALLVVCIASMVARTRGPSPRATVTAWKPRIAGGESYGFHPDLVTGALTRILDRFAHPAPNTLADLDAYRGLARRRPFSRATADTSGSRHAARHLPGLVSEDIVFPSLHEPIEATFRQRYLTDYRETHTVYARRIRPSSAQRGPRLLYLHGCMQPIGCNDGERRPAVAVGIDVHRCRRSGSRRAP